MNHERYAVVGWLAIAGAVLIVPAMILARIYDQDPTTHAVLLPAIMSLGFTGTGLSLYPLYRFRQLLNERYRYHGSDARIVLLIAGGVVAALVSILGRLFSPMLGPDALVPFLLLLLAAGVPLALLGLSLGSSLLRLETDLGGFSRPLAYTVIAASLCFVTVVLTPIGFVLVAAADVLLGLIFLREEGLGGPEFV
jgi:hypothetical protein